VSPAETDDEDYVQTKKNKEEDQGEGVQDSGLLDETVKLNFSGDDEDEKTQNIYVKI